MKQRSMYLGGALLCLAAGALTLTAVSNEAPEKLPDTPLYAGDADSVPKAPTFTVTPDAQGRNRVVVEITLPTQNKVGKPVSKITAVKLYRANVLIKEFTDPDRSKVVFTDSVPTMNMNYSYAVLASNKFGDGPKVSKTAYVGIQKPATLDAYSIQELEPRKKVRISWTAPVKDTNGRPIDPASVTYTINQVNWLNQTTTLAQDYKDTSFDLDISGMSTDCLSFTVTAKNSVGSTSAKASSNKVYTGAPLKGKYVESFAEGGIHAPLYVGMYKLGRLSFGTTKDDLVEEMKASDSDNGHMAFTLQTWPNDGQLITNYIDLTGTKNPHAMMSIYRSSAPKEGTFEILVCCDSVETSLVKDSLKNLPSIGWNPVGADLKNYIGKIVQVLYRFECNEIGYVHMDNLRVEDSETPDLLIANIAGPEKVKIGRPAEIEARLTNQGAGKTGEIELQLLCNGKTVTTSKIDGMDGYTARTVSLAHTVDAINKDEEQAFKLKVVCANDPNSSNNETSEIKISCVPSDLPAVSALKGEKGKDVLLSWTAPDLNLIPKDKVTEDFESYESLKDVNGAWTTVDGDKEEIAGFTVNGVKLGVTGPHGFFIWDTTIPPGESSFCTVREGGKKYAVSLYINKPNVLCDDWLISPELNENPQKIVYWMRAYYNFPIPYEICISKKTKNPEDFERLDSIYYNSYWKKYTYDIPQGTKYFAFHAIHNGPTNGMSSPMLMIDDVTYTPAGRGEGELVGYNIYRDGVKINKEPVKECSYLDEGNGEASHEYKVSAVYDKGESPAVAISTESMTVGLEDLVADGIKVSAGKGVINIENPTSDEAVIYSADGSRVAVSAPAASADIAVDKGIYIVRIGRRTFKLIVG